MISLVAALASGACASGQVPKEAPSEAPRAASRVSVSASAGDVKTPPRAAAFPGRFALVYAATVESGCSQSWDITTWSGEVTLAVEAGGDARLELEVSSGGVSGAQPGAGADAPSRRQGAAERCAFAGTWRAEGAEIAVAFPRAEGDATAWECRPARGGLDTDPGETWVLRCSYGALALPEGSREGPPRTDGALACRSEGGTPWIWNLVLRDGDALHLGDNRRVYARAEHGESIEGELMLPDGSLVPAPKGPSEWFLEAGSTWVAPVAY